MIEIWKDIPKYEGLYQVSNKGRVKSYRKPTKFHCPDEFVLKNTVSNSGYAHVTLYDGKSRKKFLVHRLVAEAFIPNPEGLPQINHKDENVLNNEADNLEWCTAKYNNKYGTAALRAAITKGQKIEQYLPTGEYLATYACLSVAVMITGVSAHTIGDCCAGHSQTGAGYVWRYAS